jgi:hypothetical protein
MKALLVGYGEIGKSVQTVFGSFHDLRNVIDPKYNTQVENVEYDILLVAFGYSENFEEVVRQYQITFNIKHTIIFSTVPIGTCRRLNACHCPVEGKHPDLAESIKITSKWLGGSDEKCFEFVSSAGFDVKITEPEHTEFLKLRSTTVYGVNIEFARYSKECCDKLGMDYDLVKEWDTWVNKLYSDMNMGWATRYILDAPMGPKGGHCVTPNAKILDKIFPNDLVKIVAEEKKLT